MIVVILRIIESKFAAKLNEVNVSPFKTYDKVKTKSRSLALALRRGQAGYPQFWRVRYASACREKRQAANRSHDKL